MSDPRKEGCCGLCGKEWQPANYGSPRKCAFEGEKFGGDNWQCGLLSPIREAMYDADGRTSLHYRNDEVSTYGALVVAVPGYDEFWGHGYDLSGLLVGSWYKERGCLDDLKWAFRNQSSRDDDGDELTREEAVKIAAWLKSQAEGGE